ncbi:MAG TPA: hypothetical protein VF606_03845, partial [Geminicoccaceae bacterium]
IAAAPEARKTSSPSLFSGLEFNRRWSVGRVALAYLDAPAPPFRSCSVTASVRGGFEAASILAAMAKLPKAPRLDLAEQGPGGFARWTAALPGGSTLFVNNRPNPLGFGDVEIILRPPSP